MPELPEVETTVRGLERYLAGRTLARVAVRRAGLRRPFPPELAQMLTGARVLSLGRRAKYGFIHTDRAVTMVFHLGMSGRWRIEPAALGKHDHLILETAPEGDRPGAVLALNDPRRFGSVDLVETASLAKWPTFAALGPEPLGPELHAAHLTAAFKGRASPIKTLLLDQRIVAGLGNIYVCEALHRVGIHPAREGGQLRPEERIALERAIREVLTSAIAAGGSTIRDYAQPNGELGYFAAQWRVYGREGEPCRARAEGACPGTIRRSVQAGRASFWCDVCQKL